MKKLKLWGKKGQNTFTLVNNNLYKKVNKYRWYYDGHRVFRLRTKIINLHRYIMGNPSKKLVVDHKDGNHLNNLKSNLRICTSAQNNYNSRKIVKKIGKTSSLFKGVVKRKGRKGWQASIKFTKNGIQHSIHLGSFKIEQEAAKAYNNAALKYFGKFARLNNI